MIGQTATRLREQITHFSGNLSKGSGKPARQSVHRSTEAHERLTEEVTGEDCMKNGFPRAGDSSFARWETGTFCAAHAGNRSPGR
jgi:hypothetical protein